MAAGLTQPPSPPLAPHLAWQTPPPSSQVNISLYVNHQNHCTPPCLANPSTFFSSTSKFHHEDEDHDDNIMTIFTLQLGNWSHHSHDQYNHCNHQNHNQNRQDNDDNHDQAESGHSSASEPPAATHSPYSRLSSSFNSMAASR